MKSVGIFICNYNKREYVINCVKSLLEQNFEDYDLYVIDNASTDDSVEKLKEIYGEKITLIVNSENLGGSGGFNTGIELGYKTGYKYIMLVDNDTVFDKDAIGELYKFLETNDDVGMVGAKIYQMQNPECLQELGGRINWEKYELEPFYRGVKDSYEIPDIQESEYLPACALMVKNKVIEKIGMLDEGYYIYWDDIDWNHRCRLNGYRCCTIGSAKVWHNSSGMSRSNVEFIRYYGARNFLCFFAKYIPEENIENFSQVILSRIYTYIVGFYCKKQYNMVNVFIYALHDFVHNIRGKSLQHASISLNTNKEPFHELIINSRNIFLDVEIGELDEKLTRLELVKKFIKRCEEINSELEIFINPVGWGKEELLELNRYANIISEKERVYDLKLYYCKHVSNNKKCILPTIVVDRYLNCIYNEEIYKIFSCIKESEKMFITFYKQLFIEGIKKYRITK